MRNGLKQINLETKDFKLILKALSSYKKERLKNIPEGEIKKYKLKEINDSFNPLIERIKGKC